MNSTETRATIDFNEDVDSTKAPKRVSYIYLGKIKGLVEEYYNIPSLSVVSRERSIIIARDHYYTLAREFTNASLMQIAASCQKDHSTVIHALKKFDWDYKHDDGYRLDYDNLALSISQLVRGVSTLEDEKRTEDRITFLESRIEQYTKELELIKQQ